MLGVLRPVFIGIKKRKMKPADAGRHGQAIRKGECMKYYDKLDDYTDTRYLRLTELKRRILPTVIFTGSVALMFMLCGALEVM